MTTYTAPICLECKHFYFDNGEINACDAFPDGIPEDIILGEFDHSNPYPDADNPQDNGIRFEPVED